MPVEHDTRIRDFGTRVRLYPQAPFLSGFGEPEVVWLSPPAGTVEAGPSDDRMYVVDAVDKLVPYEYPYLPPYRGESYPPVEPGPDGHFDHYPVDSREFVAVHVYGSLRRVLDIFESYVGRPLPWQFHDSYDKLELIPMISWENAQSGYGYMEFGHRKDDAGLFQPYGLNFDVIAHELGHSLLFSSMGLPIEGHWSAEFGAFHEANADIVALLSVMHFDTVLDRLLHAARGNIYTLNEINRIAELSETRQIRIASNDRKMSDVTMEVHDLSRPMTGAIFDFVAYVYVEELRRRSLIHADLWEATLAVDRRTSEADAIQDRFNRAYGNRHFQFKAALMEARDIVGTRLTAAWHRLSATDLSYADVATALLDIDREISGERYQEELREIFHWREIYERIPGLDIDDPI
ncbi:MAG TPA: hypothetical protein VM659_26270 [Dongiaceae bacterium]|nr:hypothetical protein [Dongiaceae bacterium]